MPKVLLIGERSAIARGLFAVLEQVEAGEGSGSFAITNNDPGDDVYLAFEVDDSEPGVVAEIQP